jgi:sodium transport system ATP-binding protein
MLRGKHSLLIAVCVLGLMPALAPSALELEDCRISAGPAFPGINARCGTMLRPENPDDDGSPEIEIAVAVVPALDLKPEPDPFVPLAGGPGASAIEFYAAYSGAFEHVRRHRDILLVDQRGTGSSSRMDCAVDVDIIEGAYSEERVVDVTRDCLDALPHDPRFFTTSVAVTDLEALREALGYGPLNLYGVSYGSRVAQHFAKRFPDATRSIVLDGVVAPQIVLGPEIATEAQSALDAIFARCAADETCDARFRDLPQKFRQIRAELEEQPVTVDIPNPVTGDPEITEFGSAELAGAIRLLAYNATSIAIVPLLVDAAAGGNFGPLAAQFQMIAAQMSDALALGMHNSVMCSEDAPFYDFDAVDYEALDASYIGIVQLDAIEAMCSVWPAGPVDDDFHAPLDTAIPVLACDGRPRARQAPDRCAAGSRPGGRRLHPAADWGVRGIGGPARPGRKLPRAQFRNAVLPGLRGTGPVIRVEGIHKSFGKVRAVRGVSFDAPDGKITGLLGPNGAGKSTTLRVLYTVLRPDEGYASIDGADVVTQSLEARRRIGALPHGAGLYPHLTARENIVYYARLCGLGAGSIDERVDSIIRLLEINDFADRRTKGFSQGQRTKVAIARSLVHDPQNIILDEPSNGLDVMATRSLRDLILKLKDAGRCVLFSSHVMQEVAALCDDICIIANGKVAIDDSADGIRERTGCDDLEDAFVEAIRMVEPA